MKSLIAYFLLAYGISWLIWLPLYGEALHITGLPVLPYHHALGGLGPLLASVIVTYRTQGRAGLQRLLQQCLQVKPWLLLVVALVSPALLYVLAAIIGSVLQHQPIDISGLWIAREFPQMNFVVFVVYNLFFFGFGEEVGWRGFALPRLQQKWHPLVATLVLTLFWACWHIPLFLYRPGYTAMDIAGITGWVMSLLTGSVLLTWMYNNSRGSILVCAIFHSTVDVAFTADVPYPQMIGYMGMLITVWGLIVVAYLWKRGYYNP
jgi:uncharacterized protein